jgi:hypothetical protein
MLSQKSKWAQILTTFEAARRSARALEERENLTVRYGMLLFLLFISLLGFVIFLIYQMG